MACTFAFLFQKSGLTAFRFAHSSAHLLASLATLGPRSPFAVVFKLDTFQFGPTGVGSLSFNAFNRLVTYNEHPIGLLHFLWK